MFTSDVVFFIFKRRLYFKNLREIIILDVNSLIKNGDQMKTKVFLMIIFSALVIFGQEKTDSTAFCNYEILNQIDSLDGNEYFQLARNLKEGKEINLLRLRMSFTRTKLYKPYGVFDADIYKKAESLYMEGKYNDAIKEIYSLLDSNYASVKAHLYCAFIYDKLKDSVKSNFHNNIYKGLLQSITDTGDGHSPKSAFWVISIEEEYALLNVFNLQMTQQSTSMSDNHHFDILETVDKQSGKKYNVHFNIDLLDRELRKMFPKK